MSKTRRQFTPEFKLECVLDIVSGRKRPVEICSEHQISDALLSKWRQHFMDNAATLFVAEQNRKSASNARIAELERLVGKLTLELSASKKVLSYFKLSAKQKRDLVERGGKVFPITLLCDVLGLSRSSFYYGSKAKRDSQLCRHIKQIRSLWVSQNHEWTA